MSDDDDDEGFFHDMREGLEYGAHRKLLTGLFRAGARKKGGRATHQFGVGGRGTLIGPILATFALYYLTASLGSQQVLNTNLVLGIILIVFVLIVPKGVVPTITDWFASRRSLRVSRARERRLRMRRPRMTETTE